MTVVAQVLLIGSYMSWCLFSFFLVLCFLVSVFFHYYFFLHLEIFIKLIPEKQPKNMK